MLVATDTTGKFLILAVCVLGVFMIFWCAYLQAKLQEYRETLIEEADRVDVLELAITTVLDAEIGDDVVALRKILEHAITGPPYTTTAQVVAGED